MQHFGGQVPAAPVLDLQQALDNPFLREHHSLCQVPHGEGSFQTLRNPVRYSPLPPPQRTSPQLGEHTQQLLAELGMADGAGMAEMAGGQAGKGQESTAGKAGQAPNPGAGANHE